MKTGWCILVFSFFFFISCKKETKTLNIILSKNEKTDSTSFRFMSLTISNSDSIFYRVNNLDKFKFQDTIKFKQLPTGNYKLNYYDLLGNKITKDIFLNKNVEVKIITDSINIKKFKKKTAIENLKKNAFYTLKMKGGEVASYYGYYKINRIENNYFIESYSIKKRLIDLDEFNQIKKFESELLAINEKKYRRSLSCKTFEIIKDQDSTNTLKIIDDTRNWNGWSNLFRNLNK